MSDAIIDGRKLADECYRFIEGRCSMIKAELIVTALWIFGMYFHDHFDYFPIFLISSVLPDSGKSTLMKIIDALGFNTKFFNKASAAAIKRDKERHSLLLDEADTYMNNKDSKDDYQNILNSCFDKASRYQTLFNVKSGKNDTLDTWRPVVVAGLTKLDNTTMSRSIIVQMHPSKSNLIPVNSKTKKHMGSFREDILKFADTNGERIEDLLREGKKNKTPEEEVEFEMLPIDKRPVSVVQEFINKHLPKSKNRLNDVWKSLFAVAIIIGGDWPEMALYAYKELSKIDNTEVKDHIRLLKGMAAICKGFDKEKRLSTADAISNLTKIDPYWVDYKGQGRPISSQNLSFLLKKCNIKTEQVGGYSQIFLKDVVKVVEKEGIDC